MALDPSIYGALGRVKSVQEYDNEAQQAKANKLALMLHQAQYDEYGRKLADDNELRRVVGQFGTDDSANVQSLFKAGRLSEAQAYQKSILDAQKTRADTGKITADTGKALVDTDAKKLESSIKAHDFHVQLLGSLTDPSQVPEWVQRGVQSGVFTPEQAPGVLQRFQAAMQQPGGFEQWKQAGLQGGQSATEQLKQQLEQAKASEVARHNVTSETETGRHNRSSEGIQVRGQNMVDARSKQMLDAPEYKTDADGNYIALPRKVVPGAAITATPVLSADGKPIGAGTNGKPLTETQGKATTFAARMQDAEKSIQQLESQGVSGSDLRTLAASNIYTNFLASPQGQQYRQAQENWVTANLRQESGAAIGVEEMEKDVRKFFPTVGDSPAVIAQKAQARAVAQRGMVAQAGPGAKQLPAIVGGQSSLPSADAIAAELKRRGH